MAFHNVNVGWELGRRRRNGGFHDSHDGNGKPAFACELFVRSLGDII